VSLYNAFTTTLAPSQTTTGQCVTDNYWDIGVRGDTGPSNHASGVALNPLYSVLTSTTGYDTTNISNAPGFVSQYCDGSRQPPEFESAGYAVPPGIADATVPNPIFNLTPVATVDEGNNWINLRWGPLSLTNPTVLGSDGNYGGGAPLGNYALASGSPAIDYVPNTSQTYAAAPSTDFFGNPRPDPAVANRFDIGAVEFQGSGVGTTTSISPNTGQQGTVVNVTITGTNLTLASAVNVSGTGITVTNVVAASATTVTATFTIAPNATLSARNVTVITPAGATNAGTFTVVAPPVPTLTSIAPAYEVRGGIPQNVLLTGTNFVAGSNVVITPAATGVTITNVVVTSLTTITATITSTLGAAVGPINVGVTSPGGASNTLPFAITGPVLTGIGPTSANRNTIGQAITLTGSGLTGATSVNFSGSGIAVTSLTVVGDTTINATVNIAPGATAGARNVTVTGVGGTSNAVTFTVTVPPVGLTGINPTQGARGTTQTVTLTGISFQAGANPATGVAVTGGGITVPVPFTVVNDTTITANFTIAPGAALGARNVTVTTAVGATTPVTFTVVNPGTPIINTISPAQGLRRTAAAANPVAVTLTGSNFTAGSTVNVVAPANGLTVTATVVNPTTITATFNTTVGATIGPRSITVTNPGGTSNPVTYTVLGPVLNSIAPTSALRGQGAAVPITLNGSGLTGATAVTVSGAGVTPGPITVVNDNQVTTTFTIVAGALGTARTVSVTAPGGVSNTVAFTVVIPGTPTLTNINPPSGVRGTMVPVTLTGTNFLVGETTVAVSGGGDITVSAVSVTSPTTLNATFTISPTASTTAAHNVTVTVAGATNASNALPFTVQGPTLTSIGPNTGLRGTTVPVTFTGSDLTGASAVTGLGGGVTLVAGSLTVVSSTTVTASLTISTTATTTTPHNLGLTTPIGNTNTIPFTVTGATLATISPTSATHPATGTIAVPVTLTGTNLTGTTALTGLGTGVTATGISSTATSISATLNVANTATVGARTIGATTAAGATTNTVTFMVN
jgi:hypothetical protein